MYPLLDYGSTAYTLNSCASHNNKAIGIRFILDTLKEYSNIKFIMPVHTNHNTNYLLANCCFALGQVTKQ